MYQANGEVKRLNCIVKGVIQSDVNGGRNWKHEIDKFLLSCRNTPLCPTGEKSSFLLFYKDVRDKLLTVSGTANSSKNYDAVECNHARKDKMKTYVDAKQREKQT